MALHNIKMNGKIHSSNLKLEFFFTYNDIKKQIEIS